MKHSNTHTRKPLALLAATALTVLLAACSEKPQTAGTTHSSAEHKVWSGGQKSFNTAGWTPGADYSYTSSVMFSTPSGEMYGTYQMVAVDSHWFEVDIPTFWLHQAAGLH